MPKLPVTSAIRPEREIGRTDILLERATKAELDGHREQAHQMYRQILRIDPTLVDVINRLGDAAGGADDFTTAMRYFADSLRIDPHQPAAWTKLGITQLKLGRIQEALMSFERVIELEPHSGEAHLERAITLARLGRHREALVTFDEIVRLFPNNAGIADLRGWSLQWCGDYGQALSEFDRSIALAPDFPAARISKATLLLLLGDLPGGFALFEWRWRLLERPPWMLSAGRECNWLGETSIVGKILLIYQEQGAGDVIQFCRYATIAANAGARVVIMVRPELVGLLKTLDGVSLVISDGESPPAFDLGCPVMSLPVAFGTALETVPNSIPYLRADPSRVAAWRSRLSVLDGLRVGLVWAGSWMAGNVELMAVDRRRSLPLTSLAPLASVAGCSFISLQLGPPAEQAKSPPAGMILHDFSTDIVDYMDTAALIENLDLVIGVDTSVSHLAGALGKPIWLLNRFDTCWRWLLERNDSPWYPTMRIFRQPEPGDWVSVVRSVAEALRTFKGS
jgi:tetratricopeptide (TPR) repeat protein